MENAARTLLQEVDLILYKQFDDHDDDDASTDLSDKRDIN